MFCDHLIAVLDADTFAGALTREYLKERRNNLETTEARQNPGTGEECIGSTSENRDKITAMLSALDADPSMARTQVEVVNAMTSRAEADDPIPAPTPDEDREAYRTMVRRVRIEEQDKWMPFDE
jgi:hypothetical protein